MTDKSGERAELMRTALIRLSGLRGSPSESDNWGANMTLINDSGIN